MPEPRFEPSIKKKKDTMTEGEYAKYLAASSAPTEIISTPKVLSKKEFARHLASVAPTEVSEPKELTDVVTAEEWADINAQMKESRKTFAAEPATIPQKEGPVVPLTGEDREKFLKERLVKQDFEKEPEGLGRERAATVPGLTTFAEETQSGLKKMQEAADKEKSVKDFIKNINDYLKNADLAQVEMYLKDMKRVDSIAKSIFKGNETNPLYQNFLKTKTLLLRKNIEMQPRSVQEKPKVQSAAKITEKQAEPKKGFWDRLLGK